MINYNLVKDEFDKYCHTFDLEIKQIKFKYFHSFEVANLMEELALKLKLNEEQVILAKTIGLLHDIGRFLQFTKYQTYRDNKENDHANLGVKYLFDEGNIRVFIPDDQYDEIIRKAIYNHNKFKIEDGLNEEELLFSKMIRDMDKVDIYRVVATEYNFEFNINEVYDNIIEKFHNYEQIGYLKDYTRSDDIVNKISFIFDINYKESFIILDRTKYLDLFIKSITVIDGINEFNELVDIALKYIKEKKEG